MAPLNADIIIRVLNLAVVMWYELPESLQMLEN